MLTIILSPLPSTPWVNKRKTDWLGGISIVPRWRILKGSTDTPEFRHFPGCWTRHSVKRTVQVRYNVLFASRTLPVS